MCLYVTGRPTRRVLKGGKKRGDRENIKAKYQPFFAYLSNRGVCVKVL